MGAAGVGAAVAGRRRLHRHRCASSARFPTARPPAHVDERGVIPPRGRSFQVQLDFPEPSVVIGPTKSACSCSRENACAMDATKMTVAPGATTTITADGLVWAAARKRRGASDSALRLNRRGSGDAERAPQIDQPIRAVSIIVRGIPRGQCQAAARHSTGEGELVFGYPFSGGDPRQRVNSGLRRPPSRDSGAGGSFYARRARTASGQQIFPARRDYRTELLVGITDKEDELRSARVAHRACSVGRRAGRLHDRRGDVQAPPGHRGRMSRVDAQPALAVTLHDQHYGLVFNTARQLEIR